MTVTTQAMAEAYQKYVALFNDINASREEQRAQFHVYQELADAYNASKKVIDPQVTYIATATEYFNKLEVRVLASNARFAEDLGKVKDATEAKELIAKKLPNAQVTWVTPYRFQKELTCY